MTSSNGKPASDRKNAEREKHPALMACSCGADAVWYRVVRWPDLSARALVADDFYDDLWRWSGLRLG